MLKIPRLPRRFPHGIPHPPKCCLYLSVFSAPRHPSLPNEGIYSSHPPLSLTLPDYYFRALVATKIFSIVALRYDIGAICLQQVSRSLPRTSYPVSFSRTPYIVPNTTHSSTVFYRRSIYPPQSMRPFLPEKNICPTLLPRPTPLPLRMYRLQ